MRSFTSAERCEMRRAHVEIGARQGQIGLLSWWTQTFLFSPSQLTSEHRLLLWCCKKGKDRESLVMVLLFPAFQVLSRIVSLGSKWGHSAVHSLWYSIYNKKRWWAKMFCKQPLKRFTFSAASEISNNQWSYNKPFWHSVQCVNILGFWPKIYTRNWP